MVIFKEEGQNLKIIHNHSFSVLRCEHEFDLFELKPSGRWINNTTVIPEKHWEAFVKSIGRPIENKHGHSSSEEG